MIHRELIFLDCDAIDKEDIILKLARALHESGNVKDTYFKAVSQREEEYPTGLNLGKYCIAMPHTFAEHVIEPALAVARLKRPVDFEAMGEKGKHLPVSIVIMMAISNPKEQLKLLKSILTLFGEEKMLEKIMSSRSVDEVFKIFEQIE